jgi:prepilin-type N-terminal cleavage/methylation domain-containing protein
MNRSNLLRRNGNMSRRVAARRGRARGYTAIEVLISMTLFAIGAAGVIGMQRVTVQGTEDARRYEMAVNIANTWASRLQRDAMNWNLPIATNATTVKAGSRYVGLIGSSDCATKWCFPSTTLTDETPFYDLLGRERAEGSGDHAFCVQVRTDWVANPAIGGAAAPTGFARAEVRVVFRRLDRGIVGKCTDTDVFDPASTTFGTQHVFVHVTTQLRENTL